MQAREPANELTRWVDQRRRLGILADYSPGGITLAGAAQTELARLRATRQQYYGMTTDENGWPHPGVLEALERYGDALSKGQAWKRRLEPFLKWLGQYGTADSAFERLVSAGANPLELADMVETYVDLRESRLKFDRTRPVLTPLDVRELAADCRSVAKRLGALRSQAARWCIGGMSGNLPETLEREGPFLLKFARSVDRRGQKPEDSVITLIQERIEHTTGRPNDHLLANLLGPLDWNGCLTPESLAKRRTRRGRRPRTPSDSDFDGRMRMLPNTEIMPPVSSAPYSRLRT